MSVRFLRYTIIYTNLLLILTCTILLLCSYFFVMPQWLTYDNPTKIQFASYFLIAIMLILIGPCFIAISGTISIAMHLISATLLVLPLALAIFIILNEFEHDRPNWITSIIASFLALLWITQIICELFMALCLACCNRDQSKPDPATADPEKQGLVASAVKETEDEVSPAAPEAPEEEPLLEKMAQAEQQQQALDQQAPQPFMPNATTQDPIPEVDEDANENESEDEDQSGSIQSQPEQVKPLLQSSL